MNQGKKYAEGSPEEIFALGDELVDLGLDLPFAMNMSKLLQATRYSACRRTYDRRRVGE